MTDGQGRTVDFKNTILIMTSNLGSHVIQSVSDKSLREEKVFEVLKSHFRPEFLNRVDDIVVFDSLSMADIVRIVDIQLDGLRKRLAERDLVLDVTEEAKAHLAKAGFDPDFGARPLKRAITRDVENPLAVALLEGRFESGQTVRVSVEGDRVVFV